MGCGCGRRYNRQAYEATAAMNELQKSIAEQPRESTPETPAVQLVPSRGFDISKRYQRRRGPGYREEELITKR